MRSPRHRLVGRVDTRAFFRGKRPVQWPDAKAAGAATGEQGRIAVDPVIYDQHPGLGSPEKAMLEAVSPTRLRWIGRYQRLDTRNSSWAKQGESQRDYGLSRNLPAFTPEDDNA